MKSQTRFLGARIVTSPFNCISFASAKDFFHGQKLMDGKILHEYEDYGLTIRWASRMFFNIARFSLCCFLNFFSTMEWFIVNKSLGFVFVDKFILVPPSVVSNVYRMCDSTGPE